jgi:hypothetical protein
MLLAMPLAVNANINANNVFLATRNVGHTLSMVASLVILLFLISMLGVEIYCLYIINQK